LRNGPAFKSASALAVWQFARPPANEGRKEKRQTEWSLWCPRLPCITAGSVKATSSDSLTAIRSSSTLPIAEPSTEPPTPTRMAGAANTFQFEDRGEDRGDLIKFYNLVRISTVFFMLMFSLMSTCSVCMYFKLKGI